MASTVQQYRAQSRAEVADIPTPNIRAFSIQLSSRKDRSRKGKTSGRGERSVSECGGDDSVCFDAVTLPHTPHSASSEPESNRGDPAVLLSRPVEGFHHPRQHLFTDHLIGRFFEDSSLGAETRKTNKCLAARLGTAGITFNGSNGGTRPNTTTGAPAPSLRSRFANLQDSRGRREKRALGGSASVSSLRTGGGSGGKRTATVGAQRTGSKGSSARKEQIEKEIMEQKALIEELEEKMASLSSTRGKYSNNAASKDQRRPGGETLETANANACAVKIGAECKDCRDSCRPASVPHDLEQSRSDADNVARRKKALEVHSLVRESPRGQCANDEGNTTFSAKIFVAGTMSTDVDDGARGRESNYLQEQNDSALRIQRNVRGTKRRREYASLQFARSELEHHLDSISSMIETVAADVGGQRRNRISTPQGESDISGEQGDRAKTAACTVAKFVSASRKNGLADSSFRTLRTMYQLLAELEGNLSSLATACGAATGGTALIACRSSIESVKAAERSLDRIRDSLGAPASEFCKIAISLPSSCSAHTAPANRLPAGSGRAAAVAAACGKGGILMSPEQSEVVTIRSAGKKSRSCEAYVSGGDQTGRVPLRTLGIEEIGLVVSVNGFAKHAAGFVSQAVDGAMLSDPNLCEADFRELGIGVNSPHDKEDEESSSTAGLLSFFKACQRDGVRVPARAKSKVDRMVAPGENRSSFNVGEKVAAAAAAPVSGAKRAELDQAKAANASSSGESLTFGGVSWRRSSMNLDRNNQLIVADISADEVEDESPTAPVSASTVDVERSGGGGRRMSVRCNQGVVVTRGGVQPAVVCDVDGLGKVNADTELATEEASGRPRPPKPVACRQDVQRRSSTRYSPVALDTDSDRSRTGGPAVSREVLPPEVPVKMGGVTVDVFR